MCLSINNQYRTSLRQNVLRNESNNIWAITQNAPRHGGYVASFNMNCRRLRCTMHFDAETMSFARYDVSTSVSICLCISPCTSRCTSVRFVPGRRCARCVHTGYTLQSMSLIAMVGCYTAPALNLLLPSFRDSTYAFHLLHPRSQSPSLPCGWPCLPGQPVLLRGLGCVS